MSLSQRLAEYVRACFTGLWIQSHEHEDALAELTMLCRLESWRLAVWDVERGLSVRGDHPLPAESGSSDPLAALRALAALADPSGTALLVLVNFHRFLHSPEIIQAVSRQVNEGKQRRTFVVILSPVVQLPVELEKQFVVLEHELPSRAQLAELAAAIAVGPDEMPAGPALSEVLDASAGLTRYEAEGAFSLSIVRHGVIAAPTLWEIKTQALGKSGLLQLHRGQETFASLGGLENLKSFCRRSLCRENKNDTAVRPRGILLLSPPGCGKSQFAKSLGSEVGRPTLVLDVGALMGSLVGQSEERTRQALRLVDAMAPCIVFIDELEKALGGVTNGNAGDSGVSARMFGALLTWLNDHDSDVYFIGTCNDIGKLPPEFARSERFDAVFFLDLPDAPQRRLIWRMYLETFQLDFNQPLPADNDYTGAEIKACCRLAALLRISLLEAAEYVVPVARTAQESVERLRTWAEGRCLSADAPGVYRRQLDAKPGRKVRRDPSNN